MKRSITLWIEAVVLLFAAIPAAAAQSALGAQRPNDITGGWALDLGSKYGKCTGPIDVNPTRASSGNDWTALYAIKCDGDSAPKQEPFTITYDAARGYHFTGSGAYPDIFDLRWTPDGTALVGSGSFGNQPLSASMHK